MNSDFMNTRKNADRTAPFRQLVCGTEKKVPLPNGNLKTYINFDNAASTPPLKSVRDKINEVSDWYASVHRGQGYKSRLTSRLYEETRQVIASFLNTDPKKKSIIFTSNTTGAINCLAHQLYDPQEKKQLVITSKMEHHSNLLPWRDKFDLIYLPLTSSGRISLKNLASLLHKHQKRLKIITITGASNVTGYLPPVYKIARLAHRYNTKIHVDGAQLIPHKSFSLKTAGHPEHIDFLSFSGHKIYAPFGTGVLIGPRETFSRGKPLLTGGGAVKLVTLKDITWKKTPHRQEAGSPNLMGVAALNQSLKTLQKQDMKKIARYEHQLTDYLLQKMQQLPEVKLYTPPQLRHQISILPFNLENLKHRQTAELLAKKGIGVRSGCFCAQLYVQKLLNISEITIKKRHQNPDSPHPGMVRISPGIYNTRNEIDYFIKTLKKIIKDNC